MPVQTLVKQASRLFLQFPSFSQEFCFWFSAWSVPKAFSGLDINFTKLSSVCKIALNLSAKESSIKGFLKQFPSAKSQISICKKSLVLIGEALSLRFNYTKFIALNCSKKSKGLGNQSGFVLLWLALLAPILLGALAVMASLLVMQFQKQQNVQLCRENLMEIQTQASEKAKKLLSLNPKAAHLRVQLHLVNIQIIAATAAGQVQLLALLKARRILIRAQQKSLDLFQRNLVRSAKAQMSFDLSSAHLRLRIQLESQKMKLSGWAKSEFYLAPRSAITFAFRPADALLAPQYQPYLAFEKRQSLVLSWVQKLSWGPMMKALSMPTQIKSQCRVTLKEVKWEPIIQKDRL